MNKQAEIPETDETRDARARRVNRIAEAVWPKLTDADKQALCSLSAVGAARVARKHYDCRGVMLADLVAVLRERACK